MPAILIAMNLYAQSEVEVKDHYFGGGLNVGISGSANIYAPTLWYAFGNHKLEIAAGTKYFNTYYKTWFPFPFESLVLNLSYKVYPWTNKFKYNLYFQSIGEYGIVFPPFFNPITSSITQYKLLLGSGLEIFLSKRCILSFDLSAGALFTHNTRNDMEPAFNTWRADAYGRISFGYKFIK